MVAVGITCTGLSLEVARRCDVTFNIIYRITKDNEYSGDLHDPASRTTARLLDLTPRGPTQHGPATQRTP